MATDDMDFYHVAFKVFLRDGDKLLLVHDIFGDWDLPGGRIVKDEFQALPEKIIGRKMNEEVGEGVRYTLGEQTALFRVERIDERPKPHKVRIFGVGFDAQYLGGDIKTGEYIDEIKWVDVNSFNPEEYFTGGWLKGVQDYLKKVRS